MLPQVAKPKEGIVTPQEEISTLKEEVTTLNTQILYSNATMAVVSTETEHLQRKYFATLREVASLQKDLKFSRQHIFWTRATVQLCRDEMRRKEEVWKAKHRKINQLLGASCCLRYHSQ